MKPWIDFPYVEVETMGSESLMVDAETGQQERFVIPHTAHMYNVDTNW